MIVKFWEVNLKWEKIYVGEDGQKLDGVKLAMYSGLIHPLDEKLKCCSLDSSKIRQSEEN